jgi:enoyl-CoA hydratase/carnithine racemase
MYLLPKLVGLPRAKDMVLRAQAVTGREALQIGLATELVDGERLRERAIELAAELAALPHRAYALAKEGLHQGLGSTIEREWPAAVAAQATLLASPDFQAAVQRIGSKAPAPGASSHAPAPADPLTPADPPTQKGSHE